MKGQPPSVVIVKSSFLWLQYSHPTPNLVITVAIVVELVITMANVVELQVAAVP